MPHTLIVIMYIIFFCLINRYLIKNIKKKGKVFAVKHDINKKNPVKHKMLINNKKTKNITSIKKLVIDLYNNYSLH